MFSKLKRKRQNDPKAVHVYRKRSLHVLSAHPPLIKGKKALVRTITPAQRRARKKNIRKALAARWK